MGSLFNYFVTRYVTSISNAVDLERLVIVGVHNNSVKLSLTLHAMIIMEVFLSYMCN